MNKLCRLCRVNVADKTGSHLVPHFLIKRIDNVQGKKARDYELGFVISGWQVQHYFGRAVPQQTLEGIFGELSDEDLAKNQNPVVVDNVFCSKCESRLAALESEYSKTLSNKGEVEYYSGAPYSVGFMFWSSIIWRLSLSRVAGAKLSSGQEMLLQIFLNKNLANIEQRQKLGPVFSGRGINKISYWLLRSIDFSENEGTQLFFHPKYRYPYCIVIDEFILLFSFGNNLDDLMSKGFLGLKGDMLEASKNTVASKERILRIQHAKMRQVQESLQQITVKNIQDGISKLCDRVHKAFKFNGARMPPAMKQQVFEILAHDSVEEGKKYSFERVQYAIYTVLKRHYPNVQ